MKATHADYLHPRHIRVETGQRYKAWSAGAGPFERTALCVSPGSPLYAKCNRRGLPKWPGGKIVDGLEVPAK